MWQFISNCPTGPAEDIKLPPLGLTLSTRDWPAGEPASRRLVEAEGFALVEERGLLIAGGDGNALPAGDPESPGPDNGKHRRKLDRRAAEALQELGLLDVGAHMRNTTPTVGHASKLAPDTYHSASRDGLPVEPVLDVREVDADSRHLRMLGGREELTPTSSSSAGSCMPNTPM